jgi:hypothetical protein
VVLNGHDPGTWDSLSIALCTTSLTLPSFSPQCINVNIDRVHIETTTFSHVIMDYETEQHRNRIASDLPGTRARQRRREHEMGKNITIMVIVATARAHRERKSLSTRRVVLRVVLCHLRVAPWKFQPQHDSTTDNHRIATDGHEPLGAASFRVLRTIGCILVHSMTVPVPCASSSTRRTGRDRCSPDPVVPAC